MRQIDVLRFAIDVLERLKISYAVVGSFASSTWGEPRMTRDIDIIIQLTTNQVDTLCEAFPGAEYYVSRTAANEAIQRHGQFNVIHPTTGNKIDFMIASTHDWQASQLARRKKVKFDVDTLGYVAAPEDVILGKLIYYREGGSDKHLRDITGILKISGDILDRAYLASAAAQLGVDDIWRSIVVATLEITNRGHRFAASMILAYNTNGLAHHELLDAITLLAEIGYRGVAITLDHRVLNPFDEVIDSQLASVAELLATHNMACVIETGARFLLDPRTKHEPTLVTANPDDRARRINFLCRAVDTAARLNADCVSLWSGVVHDGAGDREAFSRLVGSLMGVLDYAERHDVVLAFEPEPGMLIDTLARYDDLLDELSAQRVETARLRLTIDIGHLHCQGELPIAQHIQHRRDRLANVNIEDMRSRKHEHLMFGEGEIDFPPVIAALAKIGYAGLLGVELSRHSHEGPTAARRAYNYLSPLVAAACGSASG